MQPCPSNMMRHSFPGLHQLNPQAPTSFDADNFLDHLIASMPSGQWPDLSGTSAAQLAGDAGVAGTDQGQMFMLNGAPGEFVEGGYQDGAVAGEGSFFDSFPDQGQMEGTFTGQSLAPGRLDTGGGSGTTAPSQQKKKVRARRGQATDPHSIAERLRRVRISERMKALQELVPNANRTDKASMLDEIIEYVKFLQVQVKLLSASRLGGAAGGITRPAVDNTSQESGGSLTATGRQHNGEHSTSGGGSSLSATEQRVAKMMEEDMGSAMQYLQGKGLCLMPISLAATISGASGSRGAALSSTSGDRQSSPGISMLAV